MRAEKLIYKEVDDLPSLAISKKTEKIFTSGRVDINILLNRAREIQKKETRTNLVFAGLIISLIFIVGIILSF